MCGFRFFGILFLIAVSQGLNETEPVKPEICNGEIQSEFKLNGQEIKDLALKWTYDISNAALSIDFKYNRTNQNEYVILTLIPSSAQMIGFRLDKHDKKLNENTFWNQFDNTTKFVFLNDQNMLQLSQKIVLSNLECKSLGVYIYENTETTVNHLYSTQIGLCTNLFPSVNCFKRKIPGISRLIKQIQIHKGQFQSIYNDYFPLRNKKRDISNVINTTKDFFLFKQSLDNGIEGYIADSVSHYMLRLEKLMLLKKNKAPSALSLSASSNSTSHETSFIVRVIRITDELLGCLDATISNFVKHILIKSDENMKNAEVDLKYDEDKAENYKKNKTNNFIDVSITLKSKSEFAPLSFLDTLQFVAIKPNKSRNVFVFGDIWLDLDPDLQFVYDYEDDTYHDDKELYKYQPLWVIGLIVIAGVLAVVFIGCIVAICYKRRPYRRASKIYEMEAVIREQQIPKIPTMSLQVKATELAQLRSNVNQNLANVPYK